MKTFARLALLSAVALAGCNLTYDRDAVKFEPPVTSCPAAQTFCASGTGGVCADLTNDPLHCGNCTTSCPTGQGCVSGTCQPPVTCTSPETACPDVGAGPYCANLAIDPVNCGTCGTKCLVACATTGCDSHLQQLTVMPRFASAPGWTDWVRVVNGTPVDEACVAGAAEPCDLGGPVRYVGVPGRSSCTGLAAYDVLGAFEWTCTVDAASTPPVRFQSSGFKQSTAPKGLVDLLDIGAATASWKPNSVIVTDSGNAYARSQFAAWWSNPVNLGIPSDGRLVAPGNIYVANGGAGPIQIVASKVALVARPGALQPVASGVNLVTADTTAAPAGARDFLWIEGTFDANGANDGLSLHGVRRSALWNAKVTRTTTTAAGSAILLDNSSWNVVAHASTTGSAFGVRLAQPATANNAIIFLRVEGATDTGVALQGCGTRNSLFQTVVKGRGAGLACVHLQDAGQSQFWTLDASSCGAGILVEGPTAKGNVFKDVRVAACRAEGVVLLGGASNVFEGLVSTQNQGDGVTIQGSNENVFADVVVAANGGRGLGINTANDNVVASLTAARNLAGGVELNGASNNLFSTIAIDGTGSPIGLQLTGSKGNTFNYLAASSGGNALVEDGPSIGNTIFGEVIVDEGDWCSSTSTDPSFTSGAAWLTTPPGPGPGCKKAGPRSSFANVTYLGLFGLIPPFLGESADTLNKTWVATGTRIVDLDDPAVDWTGFDHPHRGWVLAANALGPVRCELATANRSQSACTGIGRTWSGDVVVYDWALKGMTSVLTGRVPVPAGTISAHTFSYSATPVSFDPSARELLGDGLGNENGLCDGPITSPLEECLYTPDVGAYQGEGDYRTGASPKSVPGFPNEFYWEYPINGR